MSMTDIKNNGDGPKTVVSKSAPKPAAPRPPKPATSETLPVVGHACLNGGGKQTWLVVGNKGELRKGRKVNAVSNAGKSKVVEVVEVFTLGDVAYATTRKAA